MADTGSGPSSAPWNVAQQVVLAFAAGQQRDRNEAADDLVTRLGMMDAGEAVEWLSTIPEELAAVTIMRAQASNDPRRSEAARKVLSVCALPGCFPGLDDSASARIMARCFLLTEREAAEDSLARLWGDQPMAVFRAIAEFDPRAAAVLFRDYPPAQTALKDILDNVNPEELFGDAYHLRQQGRTKEAFMALAQAIARMPDDAAQHNNMGNLLKDMGLEELAIREYQLSTQLDPNQGDAWYCLGCLYMSFKSFDLGARKAEIIMYPQAIEAFQRAIEINPKDIDAHLNLGAAYGETGQIDKAEQQFHRVLELDPSEEVAIENLRRMEATG